MNRPGHRDARTFCEQASAELRALRDRWRSEPELPQRLAVLSYLIQRSFTGAEFERELERLVAGDRPGISGAARAILLEWRGEATA